MDNTREKLIELLREVQYQGNAVHGYSDNYIQNGELADHLIAHGVTLQEHDHYWATETAYKNGYEAGFKDGYDGGVDVGKRHALKWIPVSERLPEKSEYYLAMSDGQCILVPYSHKHKAFNAFDTSETTRYQIAVTHWMPLPEPPKGE